MPAVVIVAAIAENGVIGVDNRLPWRLKSDLQHFRAITMNKPVIMGRKTYASIGKPLAGRTVIVVSRDNSFTASGIVAASTLDDALAVARGDALRRGADAIVIAGGAEIYAQALPLATRLAITHVHKRIAGDTRFPDIDDRIWHAVDHRHHPAGAGDDAAFSFADYARSAPVAPVDDHDGPHRAGPA